MDFSILYLLCLCVLSPVTAIPTSRQLKAAGTKVTICHRTNSIKNPYVSITVDLSAVDGNLGNDKGQGDHYSTAGHNGPVFDPTVHTKSSDDWGDIIPPIDGVHGGQNWNSEGQKWFNWGCKPTKSPTPNSPPTLTVLPASTNEDVPASLTITVDTHGSETSLFQCSITVSPALAGVTLSAGTDNGSGGWTVPLTSLPGLTLSTPPNWSGQLNLEVVVTSTNGGASVSSPATLNVVVEAVADQPWIAAGKASIVVSEDTLASATFNRGLMDLDGSEELLPMEVCGFPAGTVVTNHPLVSGCFSTSLTGPFTFTTGLNWNGKFDMTACVTAREKSNLLTNQTCMTVPTTIDPVNDLPSLTFPPTFNNPRNIWGFPTEGILAGAVITDVDVDIHNVNSIFEVTVTVGSSGSLSNYDGSICSTSFLSDPFISENSLECSDDKKVDGVCSATLIKCEGTAQLLTTALAQLVFNAPVKTPNMKPVIKVTLNDRGNGAKIPYDGTKALGVYRGSTVNIMCPRVQNKNCEGGKCSYPEFEGNPHVGKGASPQGKMWICHAAGTNGKYTTNWVSVNAIGGHFFENANSCTKDDSCVYAKAHGTTPGHRRDIFVGGTSRNPTQFVEWQVAFAGTEWENNPIDFSTYDWSNDDPEYGMDCGCSYRYVSHGINVVASVTTMTLSGSIDSFDSHQFLEELKVSAGTEDIEITKISAGSVVVEVKVYHADEQQLKDFKVKVTASDFKLNSFDVVGVRTVAESDLKAAEAAARADANVIVSDGEVVLTVGEIVGIAVAAVVFGAILAFVCRKFICKKQQKEDPKKLTAVNLPGWSPSIQSPVVMSPAAPVKTTGSSLAGVVGSPQPLEGKMLPPITTDNSLHPAGQVATASWRANSGSREPNPAPLEPTLPTTEETPLTSS